MPGPTRTFESNAARQRAYRRRKKEEAGAVLAEAQDTNRWAYLVQEAVAAAERSGDLLAQQVHRADAYETLRTLGDHFYDRAGLPYPQRPWEAGPLRLRKRPFRLRRTHSLEGSIFDRKPPSRSNQAQAQY